MSGVAEVLAENDTKKYKIALRKKIKELVNSGDICYHFFLAISLPLCCPKT
jgi:hypothetical protein